MYQKIIIDKRKKSKEKWGIRGKSGKIKKKNIYISFRFHKINFSQK